MSEAAGRLFTDAELEELSKPSLKLVEEMARSGDFDGAGKRVRRLYAETMAMHRAYLDWGMSLLGCIGRQDTGAAIEALRATIGVIFEPRLKELFTSLPESFSRSETRLEAFLRQAPAIHDAHVEWVTSLLSSIGRRYGDEALYAALKSSMDTWFKPFFEKVSKSDARERLRSFVLGLVTAHNEPCRIAEDGVKFVITYWCGSGGRLVREGKYEPPAGFLRIEKPHPMTYGRTGYPVYCAHCALQEILAIEWKLEPWLVVVPPEEIGRQPCLFHVYKQAVPHWVYERVGKARA